MTYLFNNQIDFVDQAIDAATRLRVSTPLTIFEHNNQYGTVPFKWDTLTVGTGYITDNVSGSTTLSTGGGAVNASAIRATRMYLHYQAGKSFYVGLTVNFGVGTTNVSKKAGFYDANNGVYFEQNGSQMNIGVISGGNTATIPQSSWNIDPVDGSGPSGLTFNPNATNNFRFDFYGSLGIRFYIYINGRCTLVHKLENASVPTPSVASPQTQNLTLRAEVTNLATVASETTMLAYNANAMSEGANEQVAQYSWAAGNGASTKQVTTTRRPIFSIRADTTGIGRTIRNYGQIIPYSVDMYLDASIYYELVINGTLTGASFSALNTNSLADIDTAATAITGGTTVIAGPLGASSKSSLTNDVSNLFPLVYSSLKNTQDTLSIVCTAFGGTANCSAAVSWLEYY